MRQTMCNGPGRAYHIKKSRGDGNDGAGANAQASTRPAGTALRAPAIMSAISWPAASTPNGDCALCVALSATAYLLLQPIGPRRGSVGQHGLKTGCSLAGTTATPGEQRACRWMPGMW